MGSYRLATNSAPNPLSTIQGVNHENLAPNVSVNFGFTFHVSWPNHSTTSFLIR